jgi:hypothetical protein
MPVIPARMTHEHQGELVVFLIGMRINQMWRPANDWPPQRPSRWSLVPGVPGILDHLVDRHRRVA